MRRPSGRFLAATSAAVLTAGLALAAAAPASAGVLTTNLSHRSSPRQVGYYIQWGVYGRGFYVKNLDTSGEAGVLTDLDYAFANVAPDQTTGAITCQSADVWADYEQPISAANSVDGVADQWGEALNGNFGQLLKLKAKYPKLKVLLSIGGYSFSKYFSDGALTAASRQALVSSCVDQFIKGNLPALGPGDAGGPGSAAGVFDGIDVDWEWPAAEANAGNVVRPQDKANLPLLLAEFRKQLDAYGQQTGKHYELSAFLPADPAKIAAGWSAPTVFQSLDYGNMQGYDLHGTWELTTNQQSALTVPKGAPTTPDFSISDSVRAWLSAGARRDQLVIGIPSYGQGWTGVTGGGTGLFQPATGPAAGTWGPGTEDYKVLATLPAQGYTVHHDFANGFAWLYNGQTFWTYDDPSIVLEKALYIKLSGLGGAMMWELSGDDATGTLTKTIHRGLSLL
jgi:chitinase